MRDIVLYRFRHFMITQRIMSRLSCSEIAEMFGTSMAQIKRTYYHLNDATRLTNASGTIAGELMMIKKL